jgi:hypothetical protein
MCTDLLQNKVIVTKMCLQKGIFFQMSEFILKLFRLLFPFSFCESFQILISSESDEGTRFRDVGVISKTIIQGFLL